MLYSCSIMLSSKGPGLPTSLLKAALRCCTDGPWALVWSQYHDRKQHEVIPLAYHRNTLQANAPGSRQEALQWQARVRSSRPCDSSQTLLLPGLLDQATTQDSSTNSTRIDIPSQLPTEVSKPPMNTSEKTARAHPPNSSASAYINQSAYPSAIACINQPSSTSEESGPQLVLRRRWFVQIFALSTFDGDGGGLVWSPW
jgi:hypothetical protein